MMFALRRNTDGAYFTGIRGGVAQWDSQRCMAYWFPRMRTAGNKARKLGFEPFTYRIEPQNS